MLIISMKLDKDDLYISFALKKQRIYINRVSKIKSMDRISNKD